MREIVPQSLFHNGLKVHDERIAANNDQRDQCQLNLHVGKTVVFSRHVLVPLGLDDFLGIDTRKAAADGNSCNGQKEGRRLGDESIEKGTPTQLVETHSTFERRRT
jgi:hypothetical protein